MSGSCTVSNVHIKDYTVSSPISYGVGGGALAPQGDATWAQVAAIIMRFCKNVAK